MKTATRVRTAMTILSRCILLLMLVSATLFAQTSTTTTTTKKTTTKKTTAKKAAAPSTASEVKLLRDALDAQQQQIQQLQSELAKRDAALQQVQQQVNALQSTTTQAQTTAQTASSTAEQNASALTQVQSSVATLSTAQAGTAAALQKNEKRVSELEEPAFINYKGVKITPGGYIQLAGIYRTHNANSDTADQYGAIPLDGSVNSRMNEIRASGRATRLSMKFEGTMPHGMKGMGYVEIDFLGSSPTANETLSSSFPPRLRLAFANVDMPGGLSVAGGQNWTLMQTTRKGIAPFTEWLPATIDNSYTPGYSYARLASFRLVKAFGAKATFAISVENPAVVQNTVCVQGVGTPAARACTVNTASATSPNVQGVQNAFNTTAPSNTSFAAGQTPSTNRVPDLLAKIAFDPGWGHFEIKGVARFFRDRIYPFSSATTPSTLGAFNQTTNGGGLGFGAVLPVVKNKFDFAVQAIAGKGIGRYSTSGGPDVTFRQDGTLIPVPSAQGIVGLEFHPSPKLDFDIYAGEEYFKRVTYSVPPGSATQLFGAPVVATGATTNVPVAIGYGSQVFFNGGCNREFPGDTLAGTLCQSAAQNQYTAGAQPVLWYRFYKGKAGTLQYGMSYAYIYRRLWHGVGSTGVFGTSVANPKGIDNIILTSFRYYLP